MFQSEIIKITIPYHLMLPVNPLLDEEGNPGEPNEFYGFITFLNDHVPNWIEGVRQKTYRGTWDLQTYVYVAELSLDMMTLPVVAMILGAGGEVEHLPMFFPVDLDATAPESLQPEQVPMLDEEGNPLLDEEENPILTPLLTWGEWFESQPTRSPIRKADGYYIGTNVFGDDYLPASQAFGLQVPLLTIPQIQQLEDYVEPEEPQDPEEPLDPEEE